MKNREKISLIKQAIESVNKRELTELGFFIAVCGIICSDSPLTPIALVWGEQTLRKYLKKKGKKMRTATFDINEMTRKQLTLTITITGLREFKVRCWLALRILDLLALVAPFSVKIENE